MADPNLELAQRILRECPLTSEETSPSFMPKETFDLAQAYIDLATTKTAEHAHFETVVAMRQRAVDAEAKVDELRDATHRARHLHAVMVERLCKQRDEALDRIAELEMLLAGRTDEVRRANEGRRKAEARIADLQIELGSLEGDALVARDSRIIALDKRVRELEAENERLMRQGSGLAVSEHDLMEQLAAYHAFIQHVRADHSLPDICCPDLPEDSRE